MASNYENTKAVMAHLFDCRLRSVHNLKLVWFCIFFFAKPLIIVHFYVFQVWLFLALNFFMFWLLLVSFVTTCNYKVFQNLATLPKAGTASAT